jgi:hypothetical protein
MGQGENKKQLLRLLNSVAGTRKTLKQVTSQWVIDPNVSLIHDTELSGKVTSGDRISINDYYPLVQYPFGDKCDTRSNAKA